jgi:hypothetical protein
MGAVTLHKLLMVSAGKGAQAISCGSSSGPSTCLTALWVSNRAARQMIVSIRSNSCLETIDPTHATLGEHVLALLA